ncbi:MAG: hypothetical protein WCK85_08085 [Chlorobium sp.]
MNIDNRYNPVRLNPTEEVAEKSANEPEFRIAYDAFEDEFAALAALLDARLQAGLTSQLKGKEVHQPGWLCGYERVVELPVAYFVRQEYPQ